MGGHRAGNIASEMAVTDLGAAWVATANQTPLTKFREWFAEYLEKENQQIHRIGQDEEHTREWEQLSKLLPLLMTKSYLCACRGFPNWTRCVMGNTIN